MKPYPTHKDSGVDWLGKVPSHWNVEKFKFNFRISEEKNGKNPKGVMLSVSGYRGIEIKEYESENQMRSVEDLEDYRVVHPGQMVVNTMWLNYAGLGVSRDQGYVSPAYRSYYIGPKIYGWYAHHLMRSATYVQGYTKYLQGIRPNSLQIKTEEFHSFPILLPPLPEQRAIAAFLDRETAKIDTLIARQEQLIALLEEKRQALISHAVTKGLDPNVKMKDSGVEWLGQVPEHWEVKKLKLITSMIGDGIHATPNYSTGTSYYFVNGNNIGKDFLSIDTTEKCVSEDEYHQLKVTLSSNTLLMSINGTIGKVCCFNRETVVFGKSIAYIDLKSTYDRRYFRRFLESSSAQRYFRESLQGTTIGNLSLNTIRNTYLSIPPVGEQELIVKYVDRAISKFDNLIEEVEFAYQLLKEKRAALISAAVTGKIDVREQVPT